MIRPMFTVNTSARLLSRRFRFYSFNSSRIAMGNNKMKPYPKMNSSNTALIVIDVVNGCAHEKCEGPEINICFSKIREMTNKLDKFIKIYREKIAGSVIFVNITPWTKEYLPENIQERII